MGGPHPRVRVVLGHHRRFPRGALCRPHGRRRGACTDTWHSKNIPSTRYSPTRICQLGCREKETSGAASAFAAAGPRSAPWDGCQGGCSGSSKTCASHTSRDLQPLLRPPMDVCMWQEADGPTLLGWLKLQPFIASLGQFRTAGVSKINTGSSGYF